MRDAAGKLSHRFHLLGLAELPLEALALGDVAHGADEHQLVSDPGLADRQLHVDLGSVLVAGLHLARALAEDLALAAAQVVLDVGLVLVALQPGNDKRYVLADDLLGLETEQPLSGRVDRFDDPLVVDGHQRVGDVLHDRPDTLLAVAKCCDHRPFLALEPLVLPAAVQGAHEVRRVDRLVEVVVGAVAHRLHGVLGRGEGGHDHTGDTGQPLLENRDQLDAVGGPQLDVQQGDVGAELRRDPTGALRIARGRHLVALRLQEVAQRTQEVPVVVDQEDSAVAHRWRGGTLGVKHGVYNSPVAFPDQVPFHALSRRRGFGRVFAHRPQKIRRIERFEQAAGHRD